ncbi:MAG: DUF1553 domain-containing protein [Planctomycetaceae bacterium]|nr:DUF1553 domain-containing protein [Planctomycetaceae bacterium]
MKVRLPDRYILIAMMLLLASTIEASEDGIGPADEQQRVYFDTDVAPILSRHGCNSSPCHGKAEGQNGFKLSVFGFDPPADYEAIVMDGRGRRVFPAAAEKSLLLTKATGVVPHGGGVRLSAKTTDYDVLRNWIESGARYIENPQKLVELRVSPDEKILAFGSEQPLRVTAVFDDGSHRDVTSLCRYRTNNEGMAEVSEEGVVKVGQSPGHVAIMAGFLDQMSIAQILIPNPHSADSPPDIQSLPTTDVNPIDNAINRRLSQLNIVASPRCDDATYLRRVSLDIIGTLPTASEARQFLDDTDPDKRVALVDTLLEREEYARYWSLKWSDLLRVDRQVLGHKDAYAYYKWIRDALATDLPVDDFARSVIAADGRLADHPAGTFFKAVPESGKRSSLLSQVFLGVRLECAECHHHPFDRISQNDYHGMRAFFEPVSIVSTSRGELVNVDGEPVAKHPRDGSDVPAHVLGQEPVGDTSDARDELARWMTSPDNPWFARNMANRLWAHFLGRGVIEPVDDLRETNPPSNPELLDVLTTILIDNSFDTKALIRSIVATEAYQRSTTPNATNERDNQNYSRATFKTMDAEVLMDAISQATDRPEKFPGHPLGIRAIDLWDSEAKHYFLNLFGRPLRKTSCECERIVETNVSQVLHVLNSGELQSKTAHPASRMSRLETSGRSAESIIEELYLTYFSRRPSAEELERVVAYFDRAESRQDAIEDLAWSLMNSQEFLFNH